MPTSTIIKDSDFQLVSEFAQPDAKKRLSLGDALQGATAYNIYRNPLGQVVMLQLVSPLASHQVLPILEGLIDRQI